MGAAQGVGSNTSNSPTKIFANDSLRPLDASEITDLAAAKKDIERYCYLLPGFIEGTDGDTGLVDVCREQLDVARRLWKEKTAVSQELVNVAKELADTVREFSE